MFVMTHSYNYPDGHSPLQPRKVFVQPNTFIENGDVVLKEYPTTPEGVIESFIERNI